MSLIAKKKESENIPPLDNGTYMFVCIGVIDIGEQRNEAFKNYSDKVIFIFEIPSETLEIDGEQKPRWLSKEYTVSLSSKSNLKKDIESWLSRPFTEEEVKDGFDLAAMLGRSGQISVIVEDSKDGTKQYNKITSILGIPKGMPSPETSSELISYDIDAHDDKVWEKIPEWIRGKIQKSTQWQRNVEPKPLDFKEKAEATTEATATTTTTPTTAKKAPF